jgi:hypothetical protein
MESPRPEDMRALVADFVRSLHAAYLDQARLLPPAEQARLPLLAAQDLVVAAAAARQLHLVATTDAFPPPTGPEVVVADELPGLFWSVRFFDPVVLPELGLLGDSGDAAASDVRRVLGVGRMVYHLSVSPGGGLTPHHAQHAGTGLANQHAAAARDYEALRAAAGGRAELVDELAVAERVGLTQAVALLAEAILPGDPSVRLAAREGSSDAVRRALLSAVRGQLATPTSGAPHGR